MSYTPPQFVDTKEQAVLALASTIKGEAVTGGDGSVNRALDVLADVLAEQDVSVPQTDAGAILALAQYASGMVKPEGTIEITENGEGIDVAQYATADVSVSGGGGGDLTTAEVTIVNSTADTLEGMVPSAAEGGGNPYAAFNFDLRAGRTTVLNAILYKGNAVLAAPGTIAVEGSATVIGEGGVLITGDCTITVS